jgi:hypothetical protein
MPPSVIAAFNILIKFIFIQKRNMKIKITTSLVLLLMGMHTTNIYSQNKIQKNMKLAKVHYEMEVQTTPQKAWEVLADYGNVGTFHPQLESSKPINGSLTHAVIGCDRECIIQDGKKRIMVKEKITNIVDGQYYTYNVYDWNNFPLKAMRNTFGVKKNNNGKTVIYQVIEYRLKPGFLTGLMKGKIRESARTSLLGYKHYMETGEKNADMTILKKKYKNV